MMALPGAMGSELPRGFTPTATQVRADEQEIEDIGCIPPLTVSSCHVRPESRVVKIEAPTAMHVVAVGQATDPTPRAPGGIGATIHELPASVERRTRPAKGPATLGETPVAIQ